MARDKSDLQFRPLPPRPMFADIKAERAAAPVTPAIAPEPDVLPNAEAVPSPETLPNPGAVSRRGGGGRPPRSGVAMTAAEKQAAYRARRKAERGGE